ncbi:hypothetical protein GCM10027074_78180 [Streptomyces deserti]
MPGQGGPDDLRAAGFEAGVCLRDQLAEAITFLRWRTAVMLSLAPGRVGGSGAAGLEGESSSGSQPGGEMTPWRGLGASGAAAAVASPRSWEGSPAPCNRSAAPGPVEP